MSVQGEYQYLESQFESAGSLPQLPKSPLRLSKMLDSTDSNPVEIETLILSDPALTAGLLRSASSVFHARSKPVTTVREAIMVLGFRSLRSMAIALWTQSLIVEASKKSFFDAGRFTKNGSFTGYLSSSLFRELGTNGSKWTAEEVYAGGVLSSISLGLLAVLHPVAYDAVYVLSREEACSLERGFMLRYEHEIAELGPLAARALGLPEMFEAVIAHVHEPTGAMDFFRPLACLNYARAVADSQGFGLPRWQVEMNVLGSVEQEITITAERLEELIGETRKHTLLHCPANAA
ncbi:MAG TPA: HDOD domain-containing protein [Fimbriimonadaceae bacterium]|nr:HDOD domain-containing protein [Fimbriimonadaceae bacterium]